MLNRLVLVVKRSRLDVNGLVNTHLRENRSVTLRYSFTKNNNLIIDEQTDSVLFSPTLPDTIRSSYPVMSLCIKKEKAIASFTQDFYKSVKYCFDSKFKGTVIEDGDTLKLGNKILNLCFHKENEKDPNLDSDLKATLETQSFGRDLSESFNHGEKSFVRSVSVNHHIIMNSLIPFVHVWKGCLFIICVLKNGLVLRLKGKSIKEALFTI